MTINLHTISVVPQCALLGNLKSWLTKAEEDAQARKFDSALFLQMRLAPDMLPLVKQVQIACDAAKLGVARIVGMEAPAFPDDETTLAQLHTRIDKTIAFLQSVPAETINASSNREVEWKARNDVFKAPALTYFTRWANPNFFFHLTTTYDLLRHSGVELGKRDFLGKL